MYLLEDELIDRALKARYRWLRSLGYQDWQVEVLNPAGCYCEDDTVVLKGRHGIAARYRVIESRGHTRLRRVYPKTID